MILSSALTLETEELQNSRLLQGFVEAVQVQLSCRSWQAPKTMVPLPQSQQAQACHPQIGLAKSIQRILRETVCVSDALRRTTSLMYGGLTDVLLRNRICQRCFAPQAQRSFAFFQAAQGLLYGSSQLLCLCDDLICFQTSHPIEIQPRTPRSQMCF